MKKDHPFYCHKKKCRKTAWDTPEYLSKEDWDFLKQVVAILETGNSDDLHNWLYRNGHATLTRDFFNHSIGWPEGWTYCIEPYYVRVTAFDAMKRHQLPKMQGAIKLNP